MTLQLSVPSRKNWLASPATGLRDGPIVPQVVSTTSAAPPQARPAIETDEQVSEEPEVHELHAPHDPGVKPAKKLLVVPEYPAGQLNEASTSAHVLAGAGGAGTHTWPAVHVCDESATQNT